MAKIKKPNPLDANNIVHLAWLAGIIDGNGILEDEKIVLNGCTEVLHALKHRFGGELTGEGWVQKHKHKVRDILKAVNGRIITEARFTAVCKFHCLKAKQGVFITDWVPGFFDSVGCIEKQHITIVRKTPTELRKLMQHWKGVVRREEAGYRWTLSNREELITFIDFLINNGAQRRDIVYLREKLQVLKKSSALFGP